MLGRLAWREFFRPDEWALRARQLAFFRPDVFRAARGVMRFAIRAKMTRAFALRFGDEGNPPPPKAAKLEAVPSCCGDVPSWYTP